MTPKVNRVDKKTIDLIFKFGKFINSNNLTFKFVLNNKNIVSDFKYPKISFIAPKSIAKTAVERNNLRRRGYRALGFYIKTLPSNIIGVFIFKSPQHDVESIKDEIRQILNKIPLETL